MHCDFVFYNAWIPSVVTYADKVEAPDGPKRFSLHHVLLLTAPQAARVSAFPKSGYRYLGRGSCEIRIFSGGLCHHAWHIHLVISQPSLRGRRRRRGHRIGMARRGKLKESRRRETCLVCTRGQYPSLSLNCSSHK